MESDNNLFENLTSKTLSTVSATNIDALTRDIHLEKANEDALRASILVNKAAMREDGGPIPATTKVVAVVSDDSGAKFLADKPEPGESWGLYGFGILDMNGRSGAVAHDVFIYDGTTYSYLFFDSVSDSSFPFSRSGSSGGRGGPGHVVIDENTQIAYAATGTFTDSTMTYTAYRVR